MKQMMPRQLPIASRASMQGMTITLCSGTGEGPTPLAAFDAALVDAGVADHNLICLSSVIPPSAVIVRDRYRMPLSDYGRRLYVVMSQMRQCEPRSLERWKPHLRGFMEYRDACDSEHLFGALVAAGLE